MNGTTDELQLVATPARGWCDPDTGLCHFNDTDAAEAAASRSETATGDASEAAER